MLSMTNVSSVAAAASYYAEDNYYSNEENQARSAWEGKGAALLGLEGTVEPDAFARVLSGEVGEVKLGKIIGKAQDGTLLREHRPGLDITLSAPKSVSLVAEVGGKPEVRAAHEAAVSKVADYIEQHLVGARVTEGGQTRFEQTGNMIVGRFHHTTSRDLDPQTHTHLVLANATQTSDGKWRSLSNELIYKNQKLLGNIYDSELAANLRELGYKLNATPEGRWEIAGVTREQIEQFSQRSQAIEARLKQFGLTRENASAAQREDAALRTRGAKREVDHAALREVWRERAAAAGIDFAAIEAARHQQEQAPIDPGARAGKADDAIRFAIDHLTERESVVPQREVLDAALTHAGLVSPSAGVRLHDLEVSLDRFIEAGTAIDVARSEGSAVTTPLALEREQQMLAALEQGRGVLAPVMEASAITTAIGEFEAAKSVGQATPFRLSPGQEDAAYAALGSSDRYVGLQGYAGTGKSTLMEMVRIAAEHSGYTVRGMAPSAEAAKTLQAESGIESVTTARFLIDEGRRAAEATQPKMATLDLHGAVDLAGRDFRSLSVQVQVRTEPAVAGYGSMELWVMDEASLSGQREMTTLLELVKRADARLILLGDKLQLNAVEAGKPFELLQQAGIDGAVMADISRQQVDDLKLAVAAAVQRQSALALSHLSERVVLIPDRGELLERAASDILEKHPQDRDKALLIVPLNKDRQAINRMVRGGLQERGDIGADRARRDVLVPSGYTDAQKQSAAYYERAQMVRFGRDYRSLGVARGEYATVVGVNRELGTVKLSTMNGRRLEWNPSSHGKVEVYDREERVLALGDEIRFTRNGKELGVTNGTLAKVLEADASTTLLSTAKGHLALDAGTMSHAHWDYAYAMTVYASQGKTANDTNFLITADSGRAMGDRSFYVGITRPRLDMTIYTNSYDKAVELIEQVQKKTSATEELKAAEKVAGNKPAEDVGVSPAGGKGSDRSAGAEM